jgi:hypothetical protein
MYYSYYYSGLSCNAFEFIREVPIRISTKTRSILTKVFRGLPSPSRLMRGQYLKTDSDHFLRYPFQFISHLIVQNIYATSLRFAAMELNKTYYSL